MARRAHPALLTVLAVFPATLLPSPGIAQQAEPPFVVEKSSWSGTLATGKIARVVNRFGDVRARFGGYENIVEVLATLQNLRPGEPSLRVDVREDAAGLLVTVGFPPATDRASPSPTPGRTERTARADLVLFIPQGIDVDLSTVDDTVEAKGIRGNLKATTASGRITLLSTSGAIDARTEHGAILADLVAGAAKRRQSLSSITGDITLQIQADANMTLEAATSGEISTDFTARISHRDAEEPAKFLSATINRGGPVVTVATKRGKVRLIRLPPRSPRAADAPPRP